MHHIWFILIVLLRDDVLPDGPQQILTSKNVYGSLGQEVNLTYSFWANPRPDAGSYTCQMGDKMYEHGITEDSAHHSVYHLIITIAHV